MISDVGATLIKLGIFCSLLPIVLSATWMPVFLLAPGVVIVLIDYFVSQNKRKRRGRDAYASHLASTNPELVEALNFYTRGVVPVRFIEE